jgi:glycosyltransferase involved in cell wall biosynthesis
MTLSTVTITKNEAEHLPQALRSIQGLADEIVVVDAGSTDSTVEIAHSFNAHVHVHPWQGYGPQKNIGLQAATGDWVLFIDADEEVTPQLAAEIKMILHQQSGQLRSHPERSEGSNAHADRSFGPRPQDDSGNITAYFVRIITEFLSKPLRHLWGTNPRLLRRTAAVWDNREIHEQVVRADGSTVRLGDPDVRLLHAPLNHPSHYRTLAAYLAKRDRYTARDAEEMMKTGRDRIGKPVPPVLRSSFSLLPFLYGRALKQFIRLFVKKRGFLDGWQGWLWCWLSAEYEYITCRKYLALVRERLDFRKKEERSMK